MHPDPQDTQAWLKLLLEDQIAFNSLIHKLNLNPRCLVNLRGVNLAGRNLLDAEFRYTDLSFADLSSSYVNGISLKSARLEGCRLDNLRGINRSCALEARALWLPANEWEAFRSDPEKSIFHFYGFDLSGADLTGRNFNKVSFSYSNFDGATLVDCIFGRNAIKDSSFRAASFKNGRFERLEIATADFTGACFDGIEVNSGSFSCSLLEAASFRGAKLKDVDLSKTIGAEHADFTDATLDDCDLDWSVLSEQRFKGTHFNNCRFWGANLRGCSFREATLKNCNFRGAVLENTDFRGQDLSGCTFDMCVDMELALFDEQLGARAGTLT